MSEFIIRTAPSVPFRNKAGGLLARMNRAALVWLVALEAAFERRRDRRMLATMSDHDLADLGIGPSEIENALREGRGSRDMPLSRQELAAVAQMRMGGWM